MELVFPQSYDPVPGRTIYKEGRLIVPYCFRDFNSCSIGGGRGEKEGGREVNKKDKTGSPSNKRGRGSRQTKREEEAGDKFHQGLALVRPHFLKFPAPVKMVPPVGDLGFYTWNLWETFYMQTLRLIFLLDIS